MKNPFDFSFLCTYGNVFKVFDTQDSSNIYFGITYGDYKYFVMFADAPTERSCLSVDEAVANLKCTVQIYNDFSHPNLIKFINAEETPIKP